MMTTINIQIFFLHFAGGNVYSFQFLRPYLPNNLNFHPIELPGRGKRMSEKLLSSEFEAVNDLVSQIVALRNNQPYIIFGHSMGATLGLKVTKKLEELGDPPKRLIVAGNAGPGTVKDKSRSKMNDEELKAELKMLGGVQDEVLNNEDLFSFFSPIMRSDFEILENVQKIESSFKINSPIIAVMGDKEETSNKIENWKNFTSNEFKFHVLTGNHFFIYDHPSDIVQIIKNTYDRPLVS